MCFLILAVFLQTFAIIPTKPRMLWGNIVQFAWVGMGHVVPCALVERGMRLHGVSPNVGRAVTHGPPTPSHRPAHNSDGANRSEWAAMSPTGRPSRRTQPRTIPMARTEGMRGATGAICKARTRFPPRLRGTYGRDQDMCRKQIQGQIMIETCSVQGVPLGMYAQAFPYANFLGSIYCAFSIRKH